MNIHVKNFLRPRIDMRAMGRRIRQLRGFELTQVELARLLGVSQAQLSKYEKGLSAPTLEILVRLSVNSGRSIDWIVTGSGGGM